MNIGELTERNNMGKRKNKTESVFKRDAESFLVESYCGGETLRWGVSPWRWADLSVSHCPKSPGKKKEDTHTGYIE